MDGIDLFKDREINIDAQKLVDATQARTALATSWVPHADARIREGAILKARLIDNLDWETISALPDVQMTIAGCQRAFYRCVNRFAAAKDIPTYINSHLQRYSMYRQMIMDRAVTKPEETNDAVRTAIQVEKREARLLGLDAPERIELSGIDGKPIRFESTHTIESHLIEKVQNLEIEEGEFLPSPPHEDESGAGIINEASPAPIETLASNILPLRPAPPQEASAVEIPKPASNNGRKKFTFQEEDC